MISEENFIKHYKHYVSFKALIYSKSGLRGYFRGTGLTAIALWLWTVVKIYSGQLVTSLFLVFGIMISFAILKWIQVRMVRRVYPELYISAWQWDREGLETIQCALIESYLNDQNIGKEGRAELKRRLEKQANEIFSSMVIIVFLPLFGGLQSSLYQVLVPHLPKDLKNALFLFGAFTAVSAVLAMLARFYYTLNEVFKTKRKTCSQVANLLSESEIRSGK